MSFDGSVPKSLSCCLDEQRLIDLAEEMGDHEIVREVLQMFLDQLPGRLLTIRALNPETADLAAVKSAVHALGSPAVTLGMSRLSDLCRDVERSSMVGDRRNAAEGTRRVIELAHSCAQALGTYLVKR
jgi:HPt (histidine-containing phosphotransfer) domain-containing protein